MNAILRSGAALSLVGAAFLGACSSNSDATRDTPTAAGNAAAGTLEGPTRADSTNRMAGMQGMQGNQMAGMMMGSGMMDSMQTHMRMMGNMSADRMKAMLAQHRQMVANLLAQLNGEMRKMNMPPDGRWTMLTDSVRRDLARMPEMSAGELRAFMPEHGARVMRLMEMHRAMRGGVTR